MSTSASLHLAFGHDTPHQLFRARAGEWADAPALRHKKKGIWHTTTWRGYYDNARAIGLALEECGVARGEVIGVLSENRPDWL